MAYCCDARSHPDRGAPAPPRRAANRERIVASRASRCSPLRESSVPVEEIARHAGVGMGTLYRHFPTKEELVDAVLEDAFAEFVRAGRAGRRRRRTRGRACRGFLERALALHGENRGLKDMHRDAAHGASGRKRCARGSGRCCGT